MSRGIYRYNMSTKDDCLEVRHMEYIDDWLAMKPQDYKYVFELEREAPRIPCVLAHLVLNGELPYGDYLINIDW